MTREEDEEEWRLKSNQELMIPPENQQNEPLSRLHTISTGGVKKESVCAAGVGSSALSGIRSDVDVKCKQQTG